MKLHATVVWLAVALALGAAARAQAKTEMLKEEPFDPATGKGFGCMECHTQES